VSIASPAVALSDGLTTQLPQPQTYVLGSVVIANLSPFLLKVTYATGEKYQQPFTEQLYDLTGALSAPLTLVSTLPAGAASAVGLPAQATATWFGVDERPAGAWPLSLAAQINNAPGILTNTVVTTGAPINDGTSYDVSRFASVLFTFSAYKLTPNNTPSTATFTVTWLIGGMVLAVDTFAFLDSDRNDTYVQTSREPVSVKGAQMTFSISAPAHPSVVSYAAIGFAVAADPSGYREQAGYWGRSGFGTPALALGLDGYSQATIPQVGSYSTPTFTAYPNTRPGTAQISIPSVIQNISNRPVTGSTIGVTVTDVIRNVEIASKANAGGGFVLSANLGSNPVNIKVTVYAANDQYGTLAFPLTMTQ
jgi:hypothetical protein